MASMKRLYGIARKFSMTAVLDKGRNSRDHLTPYIKNQSRPKTDATSSLRSYKEAVISIDDQQNDHMEEVDMFVNERMSEAVYSEYRRIRGRMYRDQARRSVERGPQQLNLLTAAQKTELRRLAREDPAQWQPQRLAAAFGVTPDAARKLLRSQWQPTSPEEVEKHDRKVAARRRALGLPVSLAAKPLPAPPVAEPAGRPPGPFTALLTACAPPEQAPMPAAPPDRGRTQLSAVYAREEVLQFPVSETKGDSDPEMRTLDVLVNLPRKHMTFDELKRVERNAERKKKLKSNSREEKILV